MTVTDPTKLPCGPDYVEIKPYHLSVTGRYDNGTSHNVNLIENSDLGLIFHRGQKGDESDSVPHDVEDTGLVVVSLGVDGEDHDEVHYSHQNSYKAEEVLGQAIEAPHHLPIRLEKDQARRSRDWAGCLARTRPESRQRTAPTVRLGGGGSVQGCVMPIDMTEKFRAWWDTSASATDRVELTQIAQDGDAPVSGDLLQTMMQNGVALVGVRWTSSDQPGYAFHLTPEMYYIVLG